VFLWKSFMPLYRSEAWMEVRAPISMFVDGRDRSKDAIERMMQNKVQEILSPRVLTKVLDKIKNTDWYRDTLKRSPGAELTPLLARELSVSAISKTTLLKISMVNTSRDDINTILSEVSRIARDESGEVFSREQRKKIATLQDDVDRFVTARDQKNDLIRTLQGDDSKGRDSVTSLQMHQRRLVSEKITIQVDYIEARKAVELIPSEDAPEELAEMPEVQMAVQQHPQLAMLSNNIILLKTELTGAKAKFGENHKTVKSLQIRLDAFETQKKIKTQQVTDDMVVRVIQYRKSNLATLQEQYTKLMTEIEVFDRKLKAQEMLVTRLSSLRQERDADVQKLNRLENRLLELNALKNSNIPMEIFKPVIKPNKSNPYMPRLNLMLPLALIFSILVAVGLAVLVEVLDTSVKNPADVLRRVDLPVLGTVPHADDVEDEVHELALAFTEDPSSVISESFRQIRMALLYGRNEQQQRSIAVLSPMPEDGRTTVAANLAQVAASGGKRVLLVDGNLRLPQLASIFNIDSSRGLSTILAGQDAWQSVVQDVSPGLAILPAGAMPPNPAELLASSTMADLLKEWYQEYDQVIFDSTPCMLMADSLALCTQVDGIVLVARAKVNTYSVLQRCRDEIRKVGGTIFGVVLNGTRLTNANYLRKSYESFYDYRGQQMLPQPAPRPQEGASPFPDDDIVDIASGVDESGDDRPTPDDLI